MESRFAAILLILFSLTYTQAIAQTKPLKFNKNKRFKIVQFTDIHFKEYNLGRRDIARSENVEAAWKIVTQPMV